MSCVCELMQSHQTYHHTWHVPSGHSGHTAPSAEEGGGGAMVMNFLVLREEDAIVTISLVLRRGELWL